VSAQSVDHPQAIRTKPLIVAHAFHFAAPFIHSHASTTTDSTRWSPVRVHERDPIHNQAKPYGGRQSLTIYPYARRKAGYVASAELRTKG
jgi:hypothetical protein